MKLSLKTKNYLGLLLLVLGIASFFFLMHILEIFGSQVEYRDPIIILKQFTPFITMLGFTFFGVALISDFHSAKHVVLSYGLPLIFAFFIGWLLNTPH